MAQWHDAGRSHTEAATRRLVQWQETDPAARTIFLAKLPSDALKDGKDASVVIRHTAFTSGGPFLARATYDLPVMPSGGRGAVRHFGADAAEVKMPDELPRFVDTPK